MYVAPSSAAPASSGHHLGCLVLIFLLEDMAAPAPTNETLLSQSSSSSPVLSQSDFPSLPTPARPAPKERVPLVLPNLQPPKPAPTSHHPISPAEPKPIVSAVRQIIPLPPKPSPETLEAASKQEARKPASIVLTVETLAPEPVPPSPVQPSAPPQPSKAAARKAKQKAASPTAAFPPLPVVEQEALVSRKTKKNKPATRPIKVKKDNSFKLRSSEECGPDAVDVDNTAQVDEGEMIPAINTGVAPTEVDNALEHLALLVPIIRDYYLENISFFNEDYVNVADPQMGYESLVRALSALSNGSPIDSLPVEAIDAAVTSFQQLLEMLSQTISDLLRLLPRLTWTDTASLDTMLKDMIRSGELMEEDGLSAAAAAAEAAYDTRTDDVAALTDALSKRARWMEAQLVKLESLHHDVNLAAVRVVMYFNDRGWDHAGKLPRSVDALARFDATGNVNEGNDTRRMTVRELEAAWAWSLQEEARVEAKLREAIQGNRRLLAFSAH
jgi:CCR4-NOT transcription complex subunit 4